MKKSEVKQPQVECKTCDFENAKHVSRGKWICPVCARDFSVEYIYWAKVAHPEWLSPERTREPNTERRMTNSTGD
jgi:ribosomal protein L37AE/L43A